MPIISQEARTELKNKMNKYQERLTEYEQMLVRSEEQVKGMKNRLAETEEKLFSLTEAKTIEGVEKELADIYVNLQEVTNRIDAKMAEINA